MDTMDHVAAAPSPLALACPSRGARPPSLSKSQRSAFTGPSYRMIFDPDHPAPPAPPLLSILDMTIIFQQNLYYLGLG